MPDIKWEFPNSGGTVKGIADAGIETFKGSLLPSLARETCQNSLDAAVGDAPVLVEFEMHTNIHSRDIPGYETYYDAINKMYDYWKDNSEPAKLFLERAIKMLDDYYINVLRISDKNTSGLLQPYTFSLKSPWHSLITIDGAGGKGANKNGGFGIGKNAPFANSLLRLVFYRTYNQDKEWAAQGVARLVSFPEDMTRERETMHRDVGFYGEPIQQMPVECIDALDKIYKRNEVGTDVFIYGFNKEVIKSWKKDIIIHLLSNFIVAIYREKIIIKVEDEVLSKDNLDNMINEYIRNTKTAEAKSCYSNYMVLTSNKKQEKELPFHGLGTAKLTLLIDPKLDLDKKVLRTRESGMALFAPRDSYLNISFSGILELEGEALKKYFKQLEPPEHNKWDKDRNENNPDEAARYIKELDDWIKGQIKEIGMASGDTELGVEGLSSLLSVQKDGDSLEGKKETLEFSTDRIEIVVPPKKEYDRATGTFISLGGKEKSKKTNKEVGSLDDLSGGLFAQRRKKGEKTILIRTKHKGRQDENGQDIVLVPEYNVKEVPLKNLVLMREGQSNQYTLVFTLPKSIESGYIEISPVGEKVSKKSKLFFVIVSARAIKNVENLKVAAGNITFGHIIGESTVKIMFELLDAHNYSMGVKIYEHNE